MWMIDHSGSRDAVLAHVKGLTADAARVAPLPEMRRLPERPSTDLMKEAVADLEARQAADKVAWSESAKAFELVKTYALAQLASYSQDATVGIHARQERNPPGPNGSDETRVSISEHP